MTCDPPWEAAEQRRESKQSRAAGEPGALELVHDPRGPQLPPPSSWRTDCQEEGARQGGTLLVPQACVSPPLQRQAQPRPADKPDE